MRKGAMSQVPDPSKARNDWKKGAKTRKTAPMFPAEGAAGSHVEEIEQQTATEVAEMVRAEKAAKAKENVPQIVAKEETPILPGYGTEYSSPDKDIDEIFGVFGKGERVPQGSRAEEPVATIPREVPAEEPVAIPQEKKPVDWKAMYMGLRQLADERDKAASEMIAEAKRQLKSKDAKIAELWSHLEQRKSEVSELRVTSEKTESELNARVHELEEENLRLTNANEGLRSNLEEVSKSLRAKEKEVAETHELLEATENPMWIVGQFSSALAQVLDNVRQHIDVIEGVVFERGDEAEAEAEAE